MYNTDFAQIEEFRRYLGITDVDMRDAFEKVSRQNYFPPKDVKMLQCFEDDNGEWIPRMD